MCVLFIIYAQNKSVYAQTEFPLNTFTFVKLKYTFQ